MPVKRSAKFGFFVVGVIALAVIASVVSKKTAVGRKVVEAAKGSAAVAASSSPKSFEGQEVLKVCVVTWGGYAGGEYYNGGFRPSKASRYWKDANLPVEFVKIDNESSIHAWESDECQVHWTTVDAFTTQVNNLREFRPKLFFQADFSRGGDVMVCRAGIKNVKDLASKHGKVALLRKSPSETLLLKALDVAALDETQVEVISTPSAPDAAKTFRGDAVDCAVVWSPDDADLTQGSNAVPGAHVVMSSKQLANAIADAFFAKEDFIRSHKAQLMALTKGWLKGAGEINSNPASKAEAVRILAAGLEQPDDFIRQAVDNVRLATYGDNQNFFGLNSGYSGRTGRQVYEDMAGKYRKAGQIEGEVPPWADVITTEILRSISLTDVADAAEGQIQFAKPTQEVATAKAFAERPVAIEFPKGSAALTDDAMIKIDREIGPIVKDFTGARIRLEGNTDSTGTEPLNRKLSYQRAVAVREYIVTKYHYDPNRFFPVGNGSDNPLASNTTLDGRRQNRRTDVAIIATP